MKNKFIIEGIDCASCATKIEEKVSKIKGIKNVNLNFLTSKFSFETEEENNLIPEVIKTINKIEPTATIKNIKGEILN